MSCQRSRTSAADLTSTCPLHRLTLLPVQDIIWKTQLQTNEVSALGLTAAEGYHAGAIRQQLIQQRLSSVPGLSGMTVQVFALVSHTLETGYFPNAGVLYEGRAGSDCPAVRIFKGAPNHGARSASASKCPLWSVGAHTTCFRIRRKPPRRDAACAGHLGRASQVVECLRHERPVAERRPGHHEPGLQLRDPGPQQRLHLRAHADAGGYTACAAWSGSAHKPDGSCSSAWSSRRHIHPKSALVSATRSERSPCRDRHRKTAKSASRIPAVAQLCHCEHPPELVAVSVGQTAYAARQLVAGRDQRLGCST